MSLIRRILLAIQAKPVSTDEIMAHMVCHLITTDPDAFNINSAAVRFPNIDFWYLRAEKYGITVCIDLKNDKFSFNNYTVKTAENVATVRSVITSFIRSGRELKPLPVQEVHQPSKHWSDLEFLRWLSQYDERPDLREKPRRKKKQPVKKKRAKTNG